jgi:hypothetical protein
MRWLAVVALISLLAFFLMRAPTEKPLIPEEEDTDAGTSAGGREPVPRCRLYGAAGGVRIGETSSPSEDGGGEPLELDPFAVELGRAAHVKDGFAIGVKRDRGEAGAPRSSYAAVALVDERVSKVAIVELARSRGDMDAPLVIGDGAGWVAAMLEPDAGGLALKLVRRVGDELKWGAELSQGRDESLAFDVALGDRIAAVVWDDVSDDGARASIMLATVTRDALEGGEDAERVSDDDIDADLPRVIMRPGGFWLAWIARERRKGTPSDAQGGDDGRYAAESIDPSWIELLPLDADGKPMGAARAVTAKDGHVLAYDLEPGNDGAALLAWRDDDTPSGADGGRVTAMLMGESRADQMQVVAEGDVGAGVPDLLGAWIAVPDRAGAMRLAPLAADGELRAPLLREPVLGNGQLLAAHGNVMLLARPAGRAVDLLSITCDSVASAPD